MPNPDIFILADLFSAVVADADIFVMINPFLAVVMHGDGFIIVHCLGAVMFDQHRFIMINRLSAVMPDPVAFVVFDFDALVFFGVQPEFFRAFFVFKAQICVGRIGPGSGADHDPGLGFILR